MTLEKAIEIQSNYLRGDEPDDDADLPASIRLGIEALKQIQLNRELWGDLDALSLPGETTE